MEGLHEMFPDVKESVLQAVLKECGGDVERAIDHLLNMGALNDPPPPSNNQANNQATTQASNNKPLSQMELDEMMARELAYGDQYNPYPAYNNQGGRGNYGGRAAADDHSIPLESIDGSVMADIVNSVKSQILPILLQQLKAIQIPPVNEQLDAGTLGQITIGLDEIKVKDATVSEDNVKVESQGTTLGINVKEISAKLDQFKWSYEKHSFPKVKDSGNADAALSETTIDVTLKMGADEYGNPCLAVTKCNVNIAKLDIKISGTLVSFVYNALLGIFKKSIKNTLETSLSDMITNSINNESSFNMF